MIHNISDFEPFTYRDDLSHYLINRNGDIYSFYINNRLEPQIDISGYSVYVLTTDSGKKISVKAHIAVAKQFIPNDDPKHKTIVNHIDENKHNPRVDNLERVTPKQNCNHGTRNKRISLTHGKPINEYDLDGHFVRTWASTRKAVEFYAKQLGKSITSMKGAENAINQCLKGRQRTSANRIWRYYSGNTDDIDATYTGYMPVGIGCSKSKLRFDTDIDVPKEYLQQPLDRDGIISYFASLDKLMDKEREMIFLLR